MVLPACCEGCKNGFIGVREGFNKMVELKCKRPFSVEGPKPST